MTFTESESIFTGLEKFHRKFVFIQFRTFFTYVVYTFCSKPWSSIFAFPHLLQTVARLNWTHLQYCLHKACLKDPLSKVRVPFPCCCTLSFHRVLVLLWIWTWYVQVLACRRLRSAKDPVSKGMAKLCWSDDGCFRLQWGENIKMHVYVNV